MILYAFKCPGCLTEWEALRKVEHRNRAALCPKCGRNSHRLLGGGGFVLKGGGWPGQESKRVREALKAPREDV